MGTPLGPARVSAAANMTVLQQSVQSRLCVVLVGARNPLNIGAAARAMSNFGFTGLRIVNDFTLPFREARSAVGASEVLASAEEYDSVAAGIADCELVIGTTAVGVRELQHPLHALPEAGELIAQSSATRVALLFGSEKTGLTKEHLSYCHWLTRIPTREEHRSMNLGQAVAVCLYELSRSEPRFLTNTGESLASGDDLLRIEEVLVAALSESGYTKANAQHSTAMNVRHLLRRMNLTANDAQLLLGMLRKIATKP